MKNTSPLLKKCLSSFLLSTLGFCLLLHFSSQADARSDVKSMWRSVVGDQQIHTAAPLLANTAQPSEGQAAIQMATSPDGGALDLVLAVIHSAKKSLCVASYSFTSKAIAKALLDKHRAGVVVRVVMDASQHAEQYTAATFLSNAGIPVRVNSRYALQHSKILLVDDDTIETGSFNFTQAAAKRNSENVLVVWHHPALAAQYMRYWQRLWDEGEDYSTWRR